MKFRGFRIDEETGKPSLKDKYSPATATLEPLAEYVPYPTRDMQKSGSFRLCPKQRRNLE